MKNTYINPVLKNGWNKVMTGLLFLASVTISHAQQGSTGNTYIFGGAEMTFFGAHDFANAGSGSLPGIIGTVRGPSMGILNFAAGSSHIGGSDAAHVDGYVRKYGSTPFIFPVGDNGNYGPFAAAADGTTGAYYSGDATTAVTSNLGGGNYSVLPTGGPFPVATFDLLLNAVSPVEYWDIDGANATPLTLTWDAASAISTLTGGSLAKLTISGWDGAKWVPLSSTVDPTSVLGGTSDLSAGSITTTSSIVPDTYTAYTLAARVSPLPVTLTSFNVFKEGNVAQLTWSTTAESNSDRFDIEQSVNGKNWNKIGAVTSNGESSVLKNYRFTDHAPATGENLYRLKMIDKDGTFAFSRIRSIKFETNVELTTYPNPVADKLLVKNYDQVNEVVVVNNTGRIVVKGKQIPAEGLDVSSFPAGIYVAKLTLNDGSVSTHKIVIAR